MTVLLTGITGNLGYEVSLDFARRGINIIPSVRPGKKDSLLSYPVKFSQLVEWDLLEDNIGFECPPIDCIVHCAGIVKFRETKNKNEQMMLNIVKLAKKLGVPVYAVSTSFVYRPNGTDKDFNNDYERDKFKAEQVLISSGVPYTILRPSILTGNSITGEIQNFSGYYLVARAFLLATSKAKEYKRFVRFPRMLGKSNMIPVDQAAKHICEIVEKGILGKIFYIINPTPPQAEWVLDKTLNFLGVRDLVTVLDIPFEKFKTLDLTEEEIELYRFGAHLKPYWSMDYEFPKSNCSDNLISGDYIKRILTFFRNAEHISYETTN